MSRTPGKTSTDYKTGTVIACYTVISLFARANYQDADTYHVITNCCGRKITFKRNTLNKLKKTGRSRCGHCHQPQEAKPPNKAYAKHLERIQVEAAKLQATMNLFQKFAYKPWGPDTKPEYQTTGATHEN